jgi:hypothetical protein
VAEGRMRALKPKCNYPVVARKLNVGMKFDLSLL